MKPHIILTIALKEFKNSLRNRWVVVISVILALLAVSISYFGSAATGRIGNGTFEVTIVSLSSLVVYLVPLIALTLGFDAIVGEAEGKTLELLLTMPITRLELFLGKFLGLGFSLISALGAGFGLAGIVIAWKAGAGQIGDYALFILTAILLGLSFLSLALLASAAVNERSKAIGVVIFSWFFFVLVFDLILMGILVGTKGGIHPSLFPLFLYLNPADIFRLINLVSIEAVKTAYGLAAVARGTAFHISLLYIGLLLWIILPLAFGYLVFKKRGY